MEDAYFTATGSFDVLKNSSSVRRISSVLWFGKHIEGLASVVLPPGKFYVRVRDFGGCHGTSEERVIGDLLRGRGRIDFRSPDFIVRAYHTDIWYICIEKWNNPQQTSVERRAPLRPFFSPISLSPRTARLMVNLSATREGDLILDPFCGTGGILIEAALMGRRIIGNDFSLAMTSGTKLNLKYYGVRNFEVFTSDILSLETGKKVDAVVSDFPYGKNSPVSDRDLKMFYARSLSRISDFLKDRGRLVMMINDPSLLALPECLRILNELSFRVHRSLTRHIIIMEKGCV
jgi:tRNA (guanine10-N2)-dimethyltransferase